MDQKTAEQVRYWLDKNPSPNDPLAEDIISDLKYYFEYGLWQSGHKLELTPQGKKELRFYNLYD